MSNKKNILIVSGTRAEFGLFESIIDTIQKSRKLSPLLLLTGMHTLKNFGNTQREVGARGYKIAKVVPVSLGGDMLLWLREEIAGIDKFCEENRVDCILVLGDRDEQLAAAIVGSHLGIPVGHIHGGDVSGDSVVDSKNRNAITQLATYHFAATKNSAFRISKMILSKDKIYIVGAPGVDLLLKTPKMSKKETSKKYKLNFKKRWLLVVMHPTPLAVDWSYDKQIKPIIEALSTFEAEIVWIYPNSDTGSDIFIKTIEDFSRKKSIRTHKNLPRMDFINLLSNVDVLIGNSSSGIIESAYFHTPVVNIGDRQGRRERSSNVIDAPYNREGIESAIQLAMSSKFKRECQNASLVYGHGNSGRKIVQILEENL